MGWFDEQIEYRKKQERELLADSFDSISQAVTGKKIGSGFKEGADVNDAITQLLKHFGIREKEVPPKIKDLEDKLDYLLGSTGIMYREVILTPGWHKDAMGPMITTMREDGRVITVLPGPTGGYVYRDPATGKQVHINGAIEKQIGTEAWCFYRPLPTRKLTIRDLFGYMFECLTVWDYVSFALSALIITLVGLIMPKLNRILMGQVITYGSNQLLAAVASFMLFATIGSLLFSMIRSMILSRISIKLNISVQAATMMRVLSLPADFFKDYTSGELSQYLSYLNSLCDTMINSLLSTGITGVFSLIYIAQIFQFAGSLVVPSLVVTISTLALGIIASAMQTVINKERMTLSAKERGLVFSLISGIQKIRLSGAENRAYVKWSEQFARQATLSYNPPSLIKLNSVITGAITLCGTGIMYYIAVKNNVSVADYYAFNASYAYISSAFSALASVALTLGTIKPSLDVIKPLMEAEPELSEGRETVTSLSGSIEFAHVSFRYEKDGPLIVDDLSLTIPARQYVAIVGRTGCGKSTLMRLLLGFETPTKGAIYYDRKDMTRLDLRSLRQHIGTVMQDGKLFGGSIFENITISAPTLKLQDAWDAAEIAGIAEDIRRMPMGMNTMIQEGSGGISGGQRQRLIIARAVAPKPKLLMLDEATSALDNITQKKVAEALDGMRCTRIVIAHRLSTIRHCDRILVLDKGKIIEDGTYEELIARNGYFAELVARQRLDTEED